VDEESKRWKEIKNKRNLDPEITFMRASTNKLDPARMWSQVNKGFIPAAISSSVGRRRMKTLLVWWKRSHGRSCILCGPAHGFHQPSLVWSRQLILRRINLRSTGPGGLFFLWATRRQ
jgi:hypothetical protein